MPYKWKEDKKKYQKEYHQEWYQKNKEKVYEKKKVRLDKIKEWFKEHKSKLKCAKCGFDHPASLDFHHEDPSEKEHNIFKMVQNGFTIKKIKAELEKCIPLCSNCHRIHHYEEL